MELPTFISLFTYEREDHVISVLFFPSGVNSGSFNLIINLHTHLGSPPSDPVTICTWHILNRQILKHIALANVFNCGHTGVMSHLETPFVFF